MNKGIMTIVLSILIIFCSCNSISFDRKNPKKDQDKVGKTFYTILKNHDNEKFKEYIGKKYQNDLIKEFDRIIVESTYQYDINWENTEYMYTELQEYELFWHELDPDFYRYKAGWETVKILEFKIYFKDKKHPRSSTYFKIHMVGGGENEAEVVRYGYLELGRIYQ